MRFQLKAVDAGNEVVAVDLEAADEAAARDIARQRGFTVLAIGRRNALLQNPFAGKHRFPAALFADTSGKSTIYEYSKVPERQQYVEEALLARPALSPFLFCNRFGEGYLDEETGECHGFESMWHRFMDRVLKETKITRRFTEHDLRRKVGSDAESLEKARALLQHATVQTTQRSYRFKPERV